MRLLAKGFLIAWLIVALAYLPAAQAQAPVTDTDQSSRLTDYLHAHRLPLVGAQVLSSSSGRSVMLYGYTATEFGKNDAEAKARRFLQDSSIVVSNHIRVRPEIASMKSPSRSASSLPPPYAGAETPPATGAPPGDVNAYQNQLQDSQQQQYVNQQAQQYMNQGNSASGLTSALIPLLGMGLAIGLGGGGTGIGVGGSGFGGSPFGGSSFGGSPFGGSQYGSPYGGGSPYGALLMAEVLTVPPRARALMGVRPTPIPDRP